MDTKHTPLPWTYQFEQGNDWGLITAGKSGPIIANVNSESCPDIQSAPCFRVMPKEANAAFICHAVNNHYELLEACKVALRAVDTALCGTPSSHYFKAVKTLLKNAAAESLEDNLAINVTEIKEACEKAHTHLHAAIARAKGTQQ